MIQTWTEEAILGELEDDKSARLNRNQVMKARQISSHVAQSEMYPT